MTRMNDDQPKLKKENPGIKSKKKKLEPLIDWGEGEVENSVWETWLEVEESTTQKRDWLTRKEADQPTKRMKQLELEFKSIFHPVSIQEEQNGLAEIISIQEERNHLAGNPFSTQEEGLVTETNTKEFSSILEEVYHHQQCHEDCDHPHQPVQDGGPREETESQAEHIGKQDEAREDSDNVVEEPAQTWVLRLSPV